MKDNSLIILFTSISCVQLTLGFAVAGTVDPAQGAWHKKYKGQENAPKPEEMLLNTDKEPELTEGFDSLFNGKDLQGWTPKGGECKPALRVATMVYHFEDCAASCGLVKSEEDSTWKLRMYECTCDGKEPAQETMNK